MQSAKASSSTSGVSTPEAPIVTGTELELDDPEFTRRLSNVAGDIDLLLQRAPTQGSNPRLVTYIRSCVKYFSSTLIPEGSLPARLDETQEILIEFYLNRLGECLYSLKPSIMSSSAARSFALAMAFPGWFFSILAKSALTLITLEMYSSNEQRRTLEIAALRYKGEAIRLIRQLSETRSHHSDDLLAASISLGTVYGRHGTREAADIHLQAARRVMNSIGGPRQIQSQYLEQWAWVWEVCSSTSASSFVWGADDCKTSLEKLNEFLSRMRRVWVRVHSLSDTKASRSPSPLPFLRSNTTLYGFLANDAAGRAPDVYRDSSQSMAQLACLLTLAVVFVDWASNSSRIFEYKIQLEAKVRESQLQPSDTPYNLLWLMSDGEGGRQHTSPHRKRLWTVAEYMHTIRYLSVEKQKGLRDWLLRFLQGTEAESRLGYTAFDFSYSM